MKPEVKDARSGNKSFLSVRYPSSENNKSNHVGVDVYGDAGVALDDNLYNLSKNYLKSIKIVAPVTHLLTHSYLLTHSLLLTHLLTHSLTYLLTHWLTHSLLLTHSLTHSLTYSLTYSGLSATTTASSTV
jgi:hypothetical protein